MKRACNKNKALGKFASSLSLFKKKSPAKKKSRPKSHKNLNPASAFSLIEILLILFILAFVFTFVSKSVFRRDQSVKASFEKLARLNRRLATLSKLNNSAYRLAIQISREGPERYWVEKQTKPKSPLPSGLPGAPTEEKTKRQFVLDASFYSEPETLMPLLDITRAESPAWEEDKTEGVVYIYYHPKGLAQRADLHILRLDSQARWTLHLDPATKNLHLLKKPSRLE